MGHETLEPGVGRSTRKGRRVFTLQKPQPLKVCTVWTIRGQGTAITEGGGGGDQPSAFLRNMTSWRGWLAVLRQVSLMCGHLDGGGGRQAGRRGQREAHLEALGRKTLHIGHVLVAWWREPTA